MNHYVYILYSEGIRKYYVGSTENVEKRLAHHNAGQNRWSKRGRPWRMVWFQLLLDKRTALQLEQKIKKRGAQRYLQDIGV